MWRRAARRLAGETQGFTLVELLIATALSLLVVAAGAGLLVGTAKVGPRIDLQSSAIQTARVSADRLTHEVRQGTSISTAATNQLSLLTYVDKATCNGAAASTAIPCKVTYTCAAGTCTRTEARPDGTGAGAAVKVFEGLSDNNVFGYLPSTAAPTYVSFKIVLPGKNGNNAITVSDGAALRNAGS